MPLLRPVQRGGGGRQSTAGYVYGVARAEPGEINIGISSPDCGFGDSINERNRRGAVAGLQGVHSFWRLWRLRVRIRRELLAGGKRVGFQLVQLQLLELNRLLVRRKVRIAADGILGRSGCQIDLINQASVFRCARGIRCGHGITVERIMEHLILFVTFGAEREFDRLIELIL